MYGAWVLQYDAWQTGHVLKHGNDPAVVNLMGKNITDRMQANIFTNHPDSGAFLGTYGVVSSCVYFYLLACPAAGSS